jgi:predicted dehydrogenase
VDTSTHLVDLVQWEAYPEQALSPSEVQMLSARRWVTPISREQFRSVTGAREFPAYLQGEVTNGVLQEYANGEFTYKLRDVFAKVTVLWNFDPPPNGLDNHYSEVRGTGGALIIRQGERENFKPMLYVENAGRADAATFEQQLKDAIADVQKDYPGVSYSSVRGEWRIDVPARYDVGHEAHFSQVTENYLSYLRGGHLPAWEEPNMITKYATIMRAFEMSR